MQEAPFKNGKKEGIAKIYQENGRLLLTVTYANDKVVSGKCENGKLD